MVQDSKKQWECRKVVRSVASPPGAVGDIVRGGQRLCAEVGKAEPGDGSRSAGDEQRSPLDEKRGAFAGRAVGQLGKGVLERIVRRLAERVMIDRLASKPREAVVASAVEF